MSGRITKAQVAFVTVLGALGSIYVWRPALEEHAKKLEELEASKSAKSS